ncbi:hypothetical protein ACLOJK_037654 [Asimina triloba]
MEHLRCSTMLMKWVAPPASTPPPPVTAPRRLQTKPSPSPPRPCRPPSSPPPTNDERRRRRSRCHGRQTHHGRATIAAIRAIHHEEGDELIPDLSRPQADVDHRGHTSRDFLARSFNRRFSPKPQQPISGHLVFSVHANEPPSASRTQQAIQQHAHERHLHAGQQQRPFCTISSSPPSSRSNGKHLAPAEPISRRPIRPCTIAHESTATAARSCPFSIKFPAVRSVLITKQPWPDLDGHDRSNRRLAAPHDVSS